MPFDSPNDRKGLGIGSHANVLLELTEGFSLACAAGTWLPSQKLITPSERVRPAAFAFRTAHCAAVTSHERLSRSMSMSTESTPSTPRSSSIWRRVASAASSGDAPFLANSIFVVKKTEGSGQARPCP